ncbi:FG-GAP-like repeat-containing protein [Microbacterium kribbense]
MLTALMAAALLTAVAPAPKAAAAELPGTILDGGYIISDAEFYSSGSMTEAQIQTFLNSKVTTCASGATCLKGYRGQLTARSADSYCKAIAGETTATAARMIYRAATACGINPKVILVMLQKEQGLVTSSKPSDWNFEHAMGQSCPDTPTGCSAAAAGFWNQVYLGSRQMQIYTKYPTSFRYRANQYNTIQWDVPTSCGSSKVFIKNQATANLYNYTPYRPNIAALAAGWGTGDSCSTYGNRNFYNYYVAWFAPDASAAKGAPAQIAACTVPAEADVSTRTATATVDVSALNARTAPTTLCSTGIRSLAEGTAVTVTGVYGAWSRITFGGATAWVVSTYLTIDSTSGGEPAVVGCAVPAVVTSASGTAVVTVSSLNARTAPSTDCSTGMQTISKGQTYARTGTYGAWWRLSVGGKQLWAHSDYLALQTAAPSPASGPRSAGVGDLTGDGARDVVAITDGRLKIYPGNGRGAWYPATTPITNWKGGAPITLGDFDGDKHPDVGTIGSDGSFWLYRGNGAGGFAAPVRIGTGWGGFTAVLGGVDFDGDGAMDVIVRNSAGYLLLYRGDGAGRWKPGWGKIIGNGWKSFTSLFVTTDFDGDGHPDIMARRSDGSLWLYRMTGSGQWYPARKIGTGWSSMTALLSPGDFDGDGNTDVLARTPGGDLLLYPGNGKGGWLSKRKVGYGWSSIRWIA